MMAEHTSVDWVIAQERSMLGAKDDRQPTALCLSGGGIRSATFSLGVLQGLAKLGRLRDFHYMSSVSGGSYIALWLAAWIQRGGGIAKVEAALKESITNGNAQHPVKRLRAYSNFLSPVHGLSADSISILAICARNLILHWTMILPIVFAVLLLPRILYALLRYDMSAALGPLAFASWAVAIIAFAIAIAFASYDTSRQPPVRSGGTKVSSGVTWWFLVPVVAGSFIVVVADPTQHDDFGWPLASRIMAGGAVLQAICELAGCYCLTRLLGAPKLASTATRPGPFGLLVASAATGAVASAAVLVALAGVGHFFPDVAQRTTLSFPLVLAALAFSNVVRAGLSQRWTEEDVREWWGRASGIVAMVGLAWLALSMVVIQVPMWLLRWAATWSGWTAGFAGIGSIALAIITTIVGFWSKHGSDVKEKALGLGRALGLRAMEIAATASMLVIAVALSLLVGLFVTNRRFQSDAATVPLRSACAADTDAKAVPCSAGCASAPSAAGLSSLQKHEACSVLVGLAVSKSELYCAQAYTMCAGACPAQPLPAACNAVATPAKPLANISAGAATSAPASPPSSWSSRSSSPAPSLMDARDNRDETRIFLQLTEANFALGWLIRHEQSLLAGGDWLALLAFVLVTFAVGASYLLGANAFSLNAFYGNRLTRAYLGASRQGRQRPHPFTGFDLKDNLPMKVLAPAQDKDGVRLLPVVNTALNLVQPSGDRLEWQERKAESFFMTPYYCGSKTLGCVPTAQYAGDKGLTAGRAMAISGAAASPSMGYHSSSFVTLLLAFFNVRLGWWMPNPARYDASCTEPLFGIVPVLSEMLSKVGSDNRFVYLSDGGHFENLGLYEMVRRRCRTILVVDAAWDPDYRYEDLEDAIRKIRVDFGVPITFEDGLLTSERAIAVGCHHFIGDIKYSVLDEGLKNGRIIYIKPVLSGNEPLDVKSYAESTRNDGHVFPQQPTSDQFFDEAQFESYRELGLHSVLEAFKRVGRGWPRRVHFDAPSPSGAEVVDDPRSESQPKRMPTSLPSEPPSSGLLGALNSFGALGQAAMVASITAAITVTGTVALKDPNVTLKDAHVSLSDASVKLADAEVRLTHDGSPLKVTIDGGDLSLPVTIDAGAVAKSVDEFLQSTDPDAKARREKIANALAEQLKNIKIQTTLSAPSLDADILKNIGEIITTGGRIISDLRGSTQDLKGATNQLRSDLKSVLGNLAALVKSLEGKSSNLENLLKGIQDELNNIETTVKGISPRQTVRGSAS